MDHAARCWLLVALCSCGRIGFSAGADARDGNEAIADALPDVVDALPDVVDAPPDAAFIATAYAYWKLDDGAGTTAVDEIGNGHPLTLVNGPAWSAGTVGGAVTGDGVDDYLVTPVQLDLSVTSAVTLSLRVNRTYTNGPRNTLVELTTNMNSFMTGFGVFPDDNTTCVGGKIMIGFYGNAGANFTCWPQPSSGGWHHLVVVIDKSLPGAQETSFYIDGIPQVAVSTPVLNDSTNTFGTEPLYLFSRGGVEEFNVNAIDEVAIWRRALTPAEIAQL